MVAMYKRGATTHQIKTAVRSYKEGVLDTDNGRKWEPSDAQQVRNALGLRGFAASNERINEVAVQLGV